MKCLHTFFSASTRICLSTIEAILRLTKIIGIIDLLLIKWLLIHWVFYYYIQEIEETKKNQFKVLTIIVHTQCKVSSR